MCSGKITIKKEVSGLKMHHRFHRITGRVLWKSFDPSSLLEQGLLKHLDYVQVAFEDLHNLYQCCYLHSKEALPDVQREPLMFQFVRIASCPSTGHH